MSGSPPSEALARLLDARPDNWRTLADLAVDFSPPHAAQAARAVLADPSADASNLARAIEGASAIVVEDTPVVVGSVEPETLDFSPVDTFTVEPSPDLQLDFGAGRTETLDASGDVDAWRDGDDHDPLELPETPMIDSQPEIDVIEGDLVEDLDDDLNDDPDDGDDPADRFDVGD